MEGPRHWGRTIRLLCANLVDICFKNFQGDHGLEISNLSLRFQDRGVELGFQKSLSGQLTTNMFYVGMAIFIMTSAHLAMLSYSSADYSNGLDFKVTMRCAAFESAFIAWGLFVAVMMKMQQRFGIAGQRLAEAGIVILLCFILVIIVLTERWYQAKMMGIEDPINSLSSTDFADTWLLLAVDTLVTVSHLALPIRWCVLWPLELGAFLVYPILVIVLGSPQQNTASNQIITITGLIFFAILGKRSLERHQRRAFHSLIAERTLRAQTEYRLNEAPSLDAGPNHPQSPCGEQDGFAKASAVGSSETGYLFQETVAASVPARLQQLASMGRRENWLVDAEDLTLAPAELLGSGGFGAVVKGSFHGLPVAVKLPVRASSSDKVKQMPDLVCELRVLRHVRHPNITMFHGAVVDPERREIALVLELVRGPSLQQFIKSRTVPLDALVKEQFSILLGTCRALQYLHGHRPSIMHGDLKPSNILVESVGTGVWAKLLDFGLSQILSRPHVEPLGGSLNWIAPELIPSRRGASLPKSSTMADLFSYGRIVHFVATGTNPFEGHSQGCVRKMLRARDLPVSVWPDHPEGSFVSKCRATAESCMDAEPRRRPGMSEVGVQLEGWLEEPGLATTLGTERAGKAAGFLDELPHDSQRPWAEGIQAYRSAQCENRSSAKVVAKVFGKLAAAAGGSSSSSSHSGRNPRREQLPALPEEALGSFGDQQEKGECQDLAQRCRPTPMSTRVAMLLQILERCYISAEEPGLSVCCDFHRVASAVMKAAMVISKSQCNFIDFDGCVQPDQQCPQCLALPDTSNMDCDVCNICNHARDKAIVQVIEGATPKLKSSL